MATQRNNLSNYDNTSMLEATDYKIAIVISEWNSQVTKGLLKGVLDTLKSSGVHSNNIVIQYVPGSFELIFGAKKLQTSAVDAVIAVGCIIQGETKHFDYVCQGVTQGIKDLNVLYDTPVIFCVLTDNNLQQSLDRSGGKYGNKGVEAAVTALKMVALNKSL